MAQLKKHPVSPMFVESSTQFGDNFQMLVIFRRGLYLDKFRQKL